MNKGEYLDKLEHVFAEQALCAQHLLTALKDEREALTNHDVDSLKQATDHKNLFVLELEKLETTRLGLQKQAEQENQKTFGDLLAWCDPKRKLEKKWADLLTIVEDCKKANETNGAVLRTQEHQINTALGVLCGISESETLYDSSGTKRQDDPGRPLAKA